MVCTPQGGAAIPCPHTIVALRNVLARTLVHLKHQPLVWVAQTALVSDAAFRFGVSGVLADYHGPPRVAVWRYCSNDTLSILYRPPTMMARSLPVRIKSRMMTRRSSCKDSATWRIVSNSGSGLWSFIEPTPSCRS